MPTYCFKLESDGTPLEFTCSVADMEAMANRDGSFSLPQGKARRDYEAEHGGAKCGQAGWPMWSDGAGVHPAQANDTMEYLRSRGVSAEINSEGQVKMESQSHRRRVLKALGLHDRNGGYGDG